MDELALGGEIRCDDGAEPRFAQKLGQAVKALRPDHDIDRRLAAQDFYPLRLGQAAGDDQRRPLPRPAAFVLELAQLAEFGIDLLRRPFANMAGVEDDKVRVFDGASLAEA